MGCGLCRRGTVGGREARADLALPGDQGCVFVRVVAVGAAGARVVTLSERGELGRFSLRRERLGIGVRRSCRRAR